MASTTFKDAVLRAVAILGLLAILLLGAWGIIQLAFFISSLFNNAGGAVSTSQTTTHELITVNVPTTATAGQPVTIGWNHTGGSGNYAYSVSYSCVTGLTFKAPVPTGSTQTVPCDTPFNYTQATSNLSITPIYSGSTDAKVTITVLATNLATGAITAQTTGTMTVKATKAATPAKTTKTTSTSGSKSSSTYVASTKHYSSLYGYSDLQVTITSVYSQNGRAALQFVIQNVGTNVTPANWTFNATLPINGSYVYTSAPQQALYPGDKIVYSMGYSDYGNTGYDYSYNTQYPYGTYGSYNPYSCSSIPGYGYGCAGASAYGYNNGYYGQHTVSVTADPYNQVVELNKGNNTASASYTTY